MAPDLSASHDSLEPQRSEIRQRSDDVLKRLDEMTERLLEVFYTIANSIDLRLTQQEINHAMFKARFDAIETRLLAAEKLLDISLRDS
jgi:hypothetical protein